MSKKIISILLVAIMLFSFTSIAVSAEDPAPETKEPEYVISQSIKIAISDKDKFTGGAGALVPFKVSVDIIDKNVVPMDGATAKNSYTIKEIKWLGKDGKEIIYTEDTKEELFEALAPYTEKNSDGEEVTKYRDGAFDISFDIEFEDKEVFGELSYQVVIDGFSAPPDIGIDLGGAEIPTAKTSTLTVVESFPTIKSYSNIKASDRMNYNDSEFIDLDGTSIDIVTTADIAGTVSFSNATKQAFVTYPDFNKTLTVDTKEIAIFFKGIRLNTIPVVVEHNWSTGPVSITTDEYTANKPGYHATVCNGCGEAKNALPHRPRLAVDEKGNPILDEEGNQKIAWESNNDATFTKNGTASVDCIDCGAKLTTDVMGSAQFNKTFANYHFLLVIFEYINLILRIIGATGVN
jgi:hypothetical protein